MRSKIILCGHLGTTPEGQKIKSGRTMAKMRIATKPRKKDEETNWWSVTAFGHSADYAISYLDKGDLVMIEGDVSIRKYEDREGNKRISVDVTADHIQGLGRRNDQREESGSRNHNDDEIPF
jgi:single-strand DNA-binding protein|tara:strand:- start:159 stop:524 length:366 start_codon:yes stop_codon:yes gene_type:complete